MGIVEAFTSGMIIDETKKEEDKSWFEGSGLFILILVIKLIFIYIVMMLWPKVMPKLLPGITKQPSYINLLGLSVILALL
tara:strand:+ start:106 stop:345 length:240 start_codon:yes stop_codon:yes gene_type:complete